MIHYKTKQKTNNSQQEAGKTTYTHTHLQKKEEKDKTNQRKWSERTLHNEIVKDNSEKLNS